MLKAGDIVYYTGDDNFDQQLEVGQYYIIEYLILVAGSLQYMIILDGVEFWFPLEIFETVDEHRIRTISNILK